MSDYAAIHEMKSISDLLGIFDSNLYNTRVSWIYRGHGDSNYKLIPSLGRLYKSKHFEDLDKLMKFEKSAVSEFQIRNYSNIRSWDKLMNLAIAQHHGLRTRFLDWSFSPLISLFFAVENEQQVDVDGSLIAYQNINGFNNANAEKFDPIKTESYQKEYYFVYSPDMTKRISMQKGIFQV